MLLKSKVVLIVDCNCICHMSYYVFRDLSYGGLGTGVIFGFLRQVFQLASRFESNFFIFCWDHPHLIRRDMYPDYKKSRRERRTPEQKIMDREAFRQFSEVRETVLPSLGFRNIFWEDGYEADDLIHAAVETVLEKGLPAMVVSTDEDLFQLLDRASMFNPRHKYIYTKDCLMKKWRVTPEQWVDVKAMSGCPSDGVEGLEGVGLKSAIKYLLGETSRMGYQTIARIRSDEGRKIIRRNLELVSLMGEDLAPLPLVWEENFSRKVFLDIFDGMNFRSFLSPEMFPKWERLFNLN